MTSRAFDEIDKGNYGKAITHLDKTITGKGGSLSSKLEPLCLKAFCLTKLNQTSNAIKIIEQVSTIEPMSLSHLASLSIAAMACHQAGKLAICISRALEKLPKGMQQAPLLKKLLTGYIADGQWKEAERVIKQLGGITPPADMPKQDRRREQAAITAARATLTRLIKATAGTTTATDTAAAAAAASTAAAAVYRVAMSQMQGMDVKKGTSEGALGTRIHRQLPLAALAQLAEAAWRLDRFKPLPKHALGALASIDPRVHALITCDVDQRGSPGYGALENLVITHGDGGAYCALKEMFPDTCDVDQHECLPTSLSLVQMQYADSEEALISYALTALDSFTPSLTRQLPYALIEASRRGITWQAAPLIAKIDSLQAEEEEAEESTTLSCALKALKARILLLETREDGAKLADELIRELEGIDIDIDGKSLMMSALSACARNTEANDRALEVIKTIAAQLTSTSSSSVKPTTEMLFSRSSLESTPPGGMMGQTGLEILDSVKVASVQFDSFAPLAIRDLVMRGDLGHSLPDSMEVPRLKNGGLTGLLQQIVKYHQSADADSSTAVADGLIQAISPVSSQQALYGLIRSRRSWARAFSEALLPFLRVVQHSSVSKQHIEGCWGGRVSLTLSNASENAQFWVPQFHLWDNCDQRPLREAQGLPHRPPSTASDLIQGSESASDLYALQSTAAVVLEDSDVKMRAYARLCLPSAHASPRSALFSDQHQIKSIWAITHRALKRLQGVASPLPLVSSTVSDIDTDVDGHVTIDDGAYLPLITHNAVLDAAIAVLDGDSKTIKAASEALSAVTPTTSQLLSLTVLLGSTGVRIACLLSSSKAKKGGIKGGKKGGKKGGRNKASRGGRSVKVVLSPTHRALEAVVSQCAGMLKRCGSSDGGLGKYCKVLMTALRG
eukprot:gnl/Dysnectes_brevis/5207_a7381_671.p1 GENE.gnl/Dysnectes_brevis/5207_a7381_671~~gnl/Dysnectes_brevis/5207_a7381_671.p1  ORF type:complete len:904 (+),score=186.86 gnl/Dysnectes_brevis/5207_a7381_671:3-2714(+)